MLPLAVWAGLLLGCSDGDGGGDEGNEADQVGVAAQCVDAADCQPPSDSDGPEYMLECLDDFRGGYCGAIDCDAHAECPEGSGCVAHDDGQNYCFRLCVDKPECNVNRDIDVEANCSANIVFVGDDLGKACVPPSA